MKISEIYGFARRKKHRHGANVIAGQSEKMLQTGPKSMQTNHGGKSVSKAM